MKSAQPNSETETTSKTTRKSITYFSENGEFPN